MKLVPKCHPDRAHMAFGFCEVCYKREYARKRWAEPEYRARQLAKKRAWEKANREKARTYAARTRSRYREKYLEMTRAWRRANPDKMAAQQAEWIRKNPGAKVVIQSRRRARHLAAPGSHTHEEWLAVCSEHGNACFYCRRADKLTQDHKIPLSRGGSNDISNIVPACASCNSRKKDKTTEEYLELLKKAA